MDGPTLKVETYIIIVIHHIENKPQTDFWIKICFFSSGYYS